MGMSTHIVFLKPPDAKWKKMRAVYDACDAAGISIPVEVSSYFNDEDPDPDGVVLTADDLPHGVVTNYLTENGSSGYEVDLTKLPKDIKTVRFYNSW